MRPVAHAKKRDADNARRLIIAAAEEEFAQKGFSGARIDEIALRAGYNKSLIFHYFTSKLELYHGVLKNAKGCAEQEFHTLLMAYVSTPEQALSAAIVQSFIRQGVTVSFNFLAARPTLRRIFTWEAAEGWVHYRDLPTLHEHMRPAVTATLAFLQRAQTAGFLRADIDPVMLIVDILGMSLSYLASLPRYEAVFPAIDFASPPALAQACEHLIRLISYGAMTPASLGDLS